MKLSAPTQMVFWIAVALAVVGLLAALIPLGFLTGLSTWLVVLGFIILAVGNLTSGM